MERTIRLLTDVESYYPDCISWGDPYKIYEVEPTGRWKVVVKNKVPTLYLECFKWIDKEYRKVDFIEHKEPIYSLFNKLVRYNKVKKQVVTTETKLSIKNLGWIPENALEVEVIEKEEFINTCGDCS